MIKLERKGRSAATVVTRGDRSRFLFSYETLVAVFVPGIGYAKTSTFYSVTTSRHVNRFGAKDGMVLSQDALEQLFDVRHTC